jgi:hypothetical protein
MYSVSEYTELLTQFFCEFAFLVGRCSFIAFAHLLSTELVKGKKILFYTDSKRKFINNRYFA